MNTLHLQFNSYRYRIEGKLHPKPSRQTDFVVDGAGLGDAFLLEDGRPWFGQTCFDNLCAPDTRVISELFGVRKVSCGLSTGRFPLYQCHCGDLQCGVISCLIERGKDQIQWLDIRYEDGDDIFDGNEPIPYAGEIPRLTFSLPQYEMAIREHINFIAEETAG